MTWTELHDACVHGDLPHVIQLARQHSEQANKVDDHGLTPLHILILEDPCSSIEAVKALLQAFPMVVLETDVHGDTPLHLAAACPTASKELVKLLMEANPTVVSQKNCEGLMPLHVACRHASQNEAVIDLLVRAFPSALLVNIKVGYITEWCCGTVDLLLLCPIESPPSLTLLLRNTLLLQMGNPAPRKGKKLHSEQRHDLVNPAAGMGAKSSIDYRFDCSVQHQIRDGAYPVHMAVESNGSLKVIDMLVKDAGEVVAKTNKYGETALHIALRSSASPAVIALLIQASPAALHVREKKEGNLPVHYAASFGCQSLAVAKALLENWEDSILERNNEQ